MKRAIQFGAGNIGRGFIGAVLSEAGYHVVFADVNMEVIDRINKDGAYTVHIMDVESRDVRISNISGDDSGGGEIVDEIVRAEIITTAVGLRILPFIAPAIAKGIAARRAAGVGEPLNVIACENGIRATSQLREEVYKHLSTEEAAWCDAHVGFADCSVDRIVPPVRSENPIDVVVENFYEWNVEEKSFVGGAPHIEGMNLADNLLAYIERKLFTLNSGHAICAYLGAAAGYAVFWGLSAALEPVAAGFLLLAGSCLLADLVPDEQGWLASAAAGGIYALLGVIFVLRAGFAADTLLPGIATEKGHIVVDESYAASIPGVFAAGDCTGAPYQIPAAVGEGNRAALSVVRWLRNA